MSETERKRLDETLVAAGLAPSRSRARDMVKRGTVSIDGVPADRPALRVAPHQVLTVRDKASGYVSRGAVKLLAGLDAFGFDPAGLDALDLGASTGGFSQVLLERGAAKVIAVDVGHGQMSAAVSGHPRLLLHEGLNARDLAPLHLAGCSVGAVVADLSFISLKLALPPALSLAARGAWAILLIKPQFEVGRRALGKGGIVRDPDLARPAAEGVAAWVREQGWSVEGLVPSPISGGDGNLEFLLGARKAGP